MKKVISALIIILALVFIYAPIILLLIFSFTEAKTIGVWSGFSLDPYIGLFTIPELRVMIGDTLLLAFLASVISAILGTVGALGIFYNKKIIGKFTKNASQIPIINAEIVTAISIALIFSFVGLGHSYFALLLGHVVLCTPFVILSVLPKLQQMDGSLYEAALDLGATPTQALFKAVIPEILPGILSGFMLAITLSLDDYMITAYTKPDSFETISTFVFGAMKKPQNAPLAELRALSSVILVIMVVVVIIMNFRKSKKAV